MIRAVLDRLAVERARRKVAAFEPAGEEQQRLRLLVIAMLDFMALMHCRPGREQDFEQAWEHVEYFRALMERPSTSSTDDAGQRPANRGENHG